MSRGFQVALLLKEKKTQLQEKVTAFVNGKSIESPLIRSLKKVEDQWGDFGQGFLHPGQTAPVAVLFSYLSTWFDLIEILTLREKKEQIAARQAEGEKKYMTRLKALPSSLAGQPHVLAASLTSGDIPRLYDQFERLEGRFHRIAFGDLSLIERILAWLHLYDPLQKSAQEYLILRKELLLPGDQTEPEDILPPDLFELACRELKELVFAARDFQKLQDVNKELEVIQEQENKALMKLLPEIARDLEKVPIIAGDEGQARENLLSIQVEINELSKRLKEETQGIMDWLHEAVARPGMISEFESKTGKGYSLLWQMPESFDPEDLLQLTTLWRTLATCWKTSNALSQVKSKLAELPTEAYVVDAVVQESKHLLELSGKVLRAVWEERVRGLDSPTIQSIYDYITAIEQMTNPAGTANYKQNKAIEGETLASAIRAFPVWAATNLSSRTNFPLKGGFFDLVILDEASQCDFPSAIPLLYRAKRVVVIGDPNQLRHIATLTPESDRQLAAQYGIAPEALSYNDHSLFDIAQRSVGKRPGALFLNEHYRSHHRVIDFSNKEFYGRKLNIKTDLAARGLPPLFIEECGGIFWMHIDGETRHPDNGSAVNERESLAIMNLVPRLEARLKKVSQRSLSIGIVTPYLAQEDSIKALVTSQKREGGDITIGTAHKFQGDERDVMIFSTVLSRGISERSLNWLKTTPNLLNVALTRARVSLIVVGDWDYCRALPTNHVFRRLADYMNQQPERIVRRADDLPFFRNLPTAREAEPIKQPNLEYSRTTLRRFLINCSRNIWWIDPDLNDQFMELFWDVFQEKNQSVSQVRLLLAQEQTQETGGSEPLIHPYMVRAFASIASSKGIQFEVRTLPKKEFPPSRMLFSNGSSYEMPPFVEALFDSQRTLEYAQSDQNDDVFLQLWERAKPA